ncbi:MAG TPA: NlpC/P60 family protein [Alphaproteobacteria bacterium]|nr:NlpC/P60 family protein [Alphaproteobacteria bacterium]
MSASPPALPKSDPRITIDTTAYGPSDKRQVVYGLAPMRKAPSDAAEMVNELRYGDTFTVYEEKDGWAFGQSGRDGYVGHVLAIALSKKLFTPTHRIGALFTFLFPEPSVKVTPLDRPTYFSGVEVVGESGHFYELSAGGFIHRARLVKLIDWKEKDPVGVAEKLMYAPYLWGGVSPLGCDCSGLVQLALEATGTECPRDSDMQMESLGAVVMHTKTGAYEKLQRGDLVFFKGHVGFMADDVNLLHANAYHGRVALEPLAEVVARGSKIIAVKRI